MNWLIFHIASGAAFFSGAVCIMLAAGLSLAGRQSINRWSTLPCLIGIVVVAASATPLPYWFYGLLGSSSIGWLYVARSPTASWKKKRWATALFVGIWTVAVGVESPYHFVPSVSASRDSHLIVYADSITAGIGEGEAETWPNILRRTKSVNISDRSQMGATVKSVLVKVKNDSPPTGIVILEIGGNDFFGNTGIAEFDRDLDRLLKLLTEQHNQVVMFELPLPPFFNNFGIVQRRLAKKHGVILIPKRVLMSVLSRSNATLDSIHLTQHGHDMLADAVSDILGFRASP